MEGITKAMLEEVSRKRSKNDNPDFSNQSMKGLNLSGCDLRAMNFTGADFENADLTGVNFRESVLKGANLQGANLLCANLEYADLTDIKVDEKTQYYRMSCPASGAFVGYKKCFNDRIVQLLIPADAMRCSATNPACRCSKAKVLSIKSIDSRDSYEEASSFVDENFVYRTGQFVEVKNFNTDRWMDSTTGIHFWMTRENAIGYM